MRQIKILTLAIIQPWESVYLVQLVWLKILILVTINILDMELTLIDMDFFHTLVVKLVEM